MGGIQGFWVVQYEGVRGEGGGVMTILNDRLYGGDSGFIYLGSYTLTDGRFSARVTVRNFLPGVPNDLGIQGDFDLEIEGRWIDQEIRATATPVGLEVAGLAIKLTRCARF
jgi:T3SS negative regulator,GrlR